MSTRALDLNPLLFKAGPSLVLVDGVSPEDDDTSDAFSGFGGCGPLLAKLEARRMDGSLTVTVEHSGDAGATWSTLGEFDEVTADGDYYLRTGGPPSDRVRFSYAVDGTAVVTLAVVVSLGSEQSDSYAGSGSHQTVAADLDLAVGAGTSAAGDTAFLAAGMFNLLGDALTKTKNYLGGVIGAFSVTDDLAGELPAGAVIGIVMDGVDDVDAPVVAQLDGSDPSSVTRALAMFKARIVNNNAGSGADYGLDLYDGGVSSAILSGGGVPIAYAKADVRLSHEVCVVLNAGAPVNGTTGANVAGKGSLLIDYSNGKVYVNTNTKASPTWTVVGTQS